MKKLLFLFFFLIPYLSFAQEVLVTGKVLSKSDDDYIAGVNIIEKGTNNGTVSDGNGLFNIKVKDSRSILVFSFVGMKTKEIQLKDNNNLIVEMDYDEGKELFDDQYISGFVKSGLLNNPIGVGIEFSFPRYFNTVPGTLNTKFEYQSNLKNNSFKVAAIEYIGFYSFYKGSLSASSNYKNLKFNDIIAKTISLELELKYNYHVTYITGYSNLKLNKFNKSSGIVLGLKKDWAGLLKMQLKAKTAIFKNNIEIEAKINRHFKRLYTFVDYSSLSKFNEISIGFGLNSYYFFPERF
jgi:CarboxypepD_reg-like domain